MVVRYLVTHFKIDSSLKNGMFACFKVDEESQSFPPPYSDTMDLPTYAECMRAKQIEDAERQEDTTAIISGQEATTEVISLHISKYIL